MVLLKQKYNNIIINEKPKSEESIDISIRKR